MMPSAWSDDTILVYDMVYVAHSLTFSRNTQHAFSEAIVRAGPLGKHIYEITLGELLTNAYFKVRLWSSTTSFDKIISNSIFRQRIYKFV